MMTGVRGRVGLRPLLAPAVAALAACTASPPQHLRLEITEFAFPNPPADVAVGDTITWINRDIVPHTVTASDQWDSGELKTGEAFTTVLATRDTIRYVCRYHPSMVGVLAPR